MAQFVWESGKVTANIVFGTIAPVSGGAEIYFNPPAFTPEGSWPPVGQKVEFVRYRSQANWAKRVRAV
ncbi:hypothetical protein SAMN05428974_0534 [Sphingopyxis sp. YR583]|uniref:hypothetical protein n=1 Tax=Sphingopyxis sp. YR583 TaxID=1881047 RepID=UPI0008A75594|nr:hypothetical protein [Sphingopyxis sp. YR583]SEH12672.1 hypothetical protein SAMN05428974_0534 [Sphingopyxis sp. YR583]